MQTRWNTFDNFQKILLCTLATMVVLFAILTNNSRGRLGVEFHDALLKVEGTTKHGAYFGKAQGTDVRIEVNQDSDTVTLVEFTIGEEVHDLCVVEYPLEPIQTEHGPKPGLRILRNNEILFEGAYDPADYADEVGYVLYDLDGQFTFSLFYSTHVYGGGNSYWEHYEPGVEAILRFANGPECASRGDWKGFLAACFIALLAAVITAFPDELFYMKHCWYVENPEPTDFYYAMQRLGAALLTIIALVVFILALCTISVTF